MSKNKVVPIQHDRFGHPAPTLVRRDETKVGDVRHRRFILNIGRQRIAFDFASRVTELKPAPANNPPPYCRCRTARRRPSCGAALGP